MTVSTQNQLNSYSGDGVVSQFAYQFKIFEDADLEVIVRDSNGVETVQTLTTHYTVTGAGTDNGGNVLFVTAPASGTSIYIRRLLSAVQETDYQEGATFPAASHEQALDRLTMISQQLQEQIDRCIKASITTPISDTEFTDVSNDRVNKIFAFDNNGNIDVTQELGIYRGNWATATAYKVRDIVRDSGNLNVYIVNQAHTSSGSLPISGNADAAKFDILIDSTGVVSAAVSGASSAAAASAAAALLSEQAADASEAQALTYSQTAATQATAAQGHSSDAQSYASIAAGHSSDASGYATTATTQAGIATTKAAEANQSAVDAAQTFDDFEIRYLGYFAVDPTTDNNGQALIDGALYYDTTNNVLKVYDLGTTSWLATTPSAANLAKIDTVQADLVGANTIGTVASNIGDIQVLAPISSDVTAVATNNTNVTTVAGQITPTNNIQTLGGISTDITEVAGISTAVSNVSSIETPIVNVDASLTEIVGVYTSLGSIINVDNNQSDIDVVSQNIGSVQAVGTNIGAVTNASDNISSIQNFGLSYLGAKTADPSTDNDGNPLVDGQLYYNTVDDVMKVYDLSSTSWVGWAVSGNTATRWEFLLTGDTTTIPNSLADQNSSTLSGLGPDTKVYVNGVLLAYADDYTHTSDSVTFQGVVPSGAIVVITSSEISYASGALSTGGGTVSGSLTVTQALNTDTLTVNGNSTFTGDVGIGAGSTVTVGAGSTVPWVDLSSTQTVAGLKEFNDGIRVGGNEGITAIEFTAISNPSIFNVKWAGQTTLTSSQWNSGECYKIGRLITIDGEFKVNYTISGSIQVGDGFVLSNVNTGFDWPATYMAPAGQFIIKSQYSSLFYNQGNPYAIGTVHPENANLVFHVTQTFNGAVNPASSDWIRFTVTFKTSNAG